MLPVRGGERRMSSAFGCNYTVLIGSIISLLLRTLSRQGVFRWSRDGVCY